MAKNKKKGDYVIRQALKDELGKTLAEIQKSRDISIKQMADSCGLPARNVENYTNGSNLITLDALYSLHIHLGVDVNDLFDKIHGHQTKESRKLITKFTVKDKDGNPQVFEITLVNEEEEKEGKEKEEENKN